MTSKNAINSSSGYFIHMNNRCQKFIPLRVYNKLRKGLKRFIGEDVEIVLNKVMILFRCLRDNIHV
ncbi:Cullin-3A [Apostasia shenzhenica]|uniref:Cullin-3A n=1 Tax=Apostasia shenzhenica TaxID=1088818 RepID=A0A2I0AV88_9ASPA|nr:Cullin-3A [Apostasia shenzhenica]